MGRLLSRTAATAILLMPAFATAEDIKTYQADFWKGGAQVGSDGQLFDCYMRAENLRDGYSIFLRWDDTGLHVSLFDNTWSLSAADNASGRVRVDQRYDENVPVQLLAPSVVDYRFGYDGWAWDAISTGSRISLEGPQGRIEFPLTGTGAAMRELNTCANEFFPEPFDEELPSPEPESAKPDAPVASAPAPASTVNPAQLIEAALMIVAGDIEGTPEDAFGMLDLAAQEGHRDALWISGRFALAGYGTDLPRDQAMARILAAAEADQLDALTFLGAEYLASSDAEMREVGRDYLERAAAQDYAPARVALQLLDGEDGP